MYGLARVKNRRDWKTVSVKIESGCQHPSPKTQSLNLDFISGMHLKSDKKVFLVFILISHLFTTGFSFLRLAEKGGNLWLSDHDVFLGATRKVPCPQHVTLYCFDFNVYLDACWYRLDWTVKFNASVLLMRSSTSSRGFENEVAVRVLQSKLTFKANHISANQTW